MSGPQGNGVAYEPVEPTINIVVHIAPGGRGIPVMEFTGMELRQVVEVLHQCQCQALVEIGKQQQRAEAAGVDGSSRIIRVV
jgi:hypothetical protein